MRFDFFHIFFSFLIIFLVAYLWIFVWNFVLIFISISFFSIVQLFFLYLSFIHAFKFSFSFFHLIIIFLFILIFILFKLNVFYHAFRNGPRNFFNRFSCFCSQYNMCRIFFLHFGLLRTGQCSLFFSETCNYGLYRWDRDFFIYNRSGRIHEPVIFMEYWYNKSIFLKWYFTIMAPEFIFWNYFKNITNENKKPFTRPILFFLHPIYRLYFRIFILISTWKCTYVRVFFWGCIRKYELSLNLGINRFQNRELDEYRTGLPYDFSFNCF